MNSTRTWNRQGSRTSSWRVWQIVVNARSNIAGTCAFYGHKLVKTRDFLLRARALAEAGNEISEYDCAYGSASSSPWK